MRQRSELLELQQGVFASLGEVMPQVRRDCEKHLAEAVGDAEQAAAAPPVTEPDPQPLHP